MFPDGVGLHEQPGPAPDDLEEDSVGVGGEVVRARLHEEAVRDAALEHDHVQELGLAVLPVGERGAGEVVAVLAGRPEVVGRGPQQRHQPRVLLAEAVEIRSIVVGGMGCIVSISVLCPDLICTVSTIQGS